MQSTIDSHPAKTQMSNKSNVIENQVQNVLTTAKCKLNNLDSDIEELERENQMILDQI
jgi:hypothetical protein